VIYGDADVITPPARNLDVASAWPGAAVHVIPGAGHALYLEQPDVFNALLAAFLSKSKS
jgi:3-oxoadipate enol-lactonase